jgi:uncharacterized membrane protein YebE (DUF533 family)
VAGLDQLERFVTNLEGELTLAVNDTLHAGYGLAIEYSSGTYSEDDLARLDHPFATRHGSPQLDPSVINVKSGDFRAAWHTVGPTQAAGGVAGSIINNDPKAQFLQGTRLMFARPIDDRIAHELAPVFEANVIRAVVRAAR